MEEIGIFFGLAIVMWIIASILLPFFVVGIFMRLGDIRKELRIANGSVLETVPAEVLGTK